MSGLTSERLRELVTYSPATGEMRWRVKHWSRVPGTLAGYSRPDGYRIACLHGERYLVHRLAWLYVHGCWPDGVIDHVNRDCTDNRIDNLRDTTQSSNMSNRSAPQSNSTSGLLGVTFHKARGKWTAYICHRGARIYLGLHASKDAAHAAYLEKKRELHPEAFDLPESSRLCNSDYLNENQALIQ